MEGYQAKLFHQKRVIAHRPGWRRMLSRRFYLATLTDDGLNGFHSLMCMDEVDTPLVRSIRGRQTTLVDRGYAWLQYYLTGSDFSAVATIDPQGNLVQWYLDVISGMGINGDGYPWYDDLYLDVIATPEGWVEIIDGEDLDAALVNGVIDQRLYGQAWRSAERLAGELQRGEFYLNQRVEKDRSSLLEGSPILVGNW